MKIRNFKNFINEGDSTESGGFDWFDKKYLLGLGWRERGGVFHRQKEGIDYQMVFKSDSEKGPGFELSKVVGGNQKNKEILMTLFKEDDCWVSFKKWHSETFGKKENNVSIDFKDPFKSVKDIFN